MKRSVYIVRHGNTFDPGDVVLRVGARTDLPLSHSGHRQAKRLGAYFASEGVHFSEALVGPLKRTLETASAILEAQKGRLEPTIFEGLRELDYGPDEGIAEGKVVARIGQAALEAWEHRAIPIPDWAVDTREIGNMWKSIFSELITSRNCDPVLIVTSNGVARFALSSLGSSFESLPKLRTGAFGVIEISSENSATPKAWDIRPLT